MGALLGDPQLIGVRPRALPAIMNPELAGCYPSASMVDSRLHRVIALVAVILVSLDRIFAIKALIWTFEEDYFSIE
jgi:hypothetical protein